MTAQPEPARVKSAKLKTQSKGSLDLAWTSLGVVQDTSKVEQGARVVRVGGALERASHPRVFWDIVRSLPFPLGAIAREELSIL